MFLAASCDNNDSLPRISRCIYSTRRHLLTITALASAERGICLIRSQAGGTSTARCLEKRRPSTRSSERTRKLFFGAVNAYDGVLLARKELEVAEQATKTAQAIFDRSKARVESGVAVESDLLNAQVRQAARKQELIRAQNNLSLAHAELARAMGVSTDKDIEPIERLAERSLPQRSLEELEKQAMETRPDLKRIQSEEAAQRQSVAIAKSSFGPRVNAFADWEADNPA